MASNEEVIIEPADSAFSQDNTDSDVTETTPLVKNSIAVTKRSSILKRFRESVLVKSKAANMILIWSFMVHLSVYGFVLNPDDYFLLPIKQLSLMFSLGNDLNSSMSGLLNVTSDTALVNLIGSGVYGLFAVWLLFYPLAGYLADVRYGRYKVIIFGIRMIYFGLLNLVIGVAIALGTFVTLTFLLNNKLVAEILIIDIAMKTAFLVGIVVFLVGLFFITCFIWSIGFAAFAANVIQFGIDQLQEFPVRDSFLFIHWFLLTRYIGVSIGKFLFSAAPATYFLSVVIIFLVLLLLLPAMPVSLCISRSKWFVIDPGIGNPYREVARVVGFARRHKVPIQRSAFTYWEDDIPTGLDLGKSKYGGPFTTEEVENVKAFFGISYILLSLGPFFTADIAASAFLPVLKNHLDNKAPVVNSINSFSGESLVYCLFANGGTLYPLFIVVLIPVFLKIIHPLFQNLMPSILKRIGIGLGLITLSLLCSLLIDTIGHALPSGKHATSVFDPGLLPVLIQEPADSSLQLSPYILIIENFFVAVAYILIYGGVFEFICAQSPHSMKGVLIGIFFAVKGLFQLIGVLVILLPFSFWQTSDTYAGLPGLVYFLVNIVTSVVGVVAFTVTARRYQYRQRDEYCNIRKYIEDYHEKDISHNPVFEDLDVHCGEFDERNR